ncbi:MAG: MFS transporter, partial [Planctomycetaceae bacterium]
LGILSFTYLPHTPPKGRDATAEKTGVGIRELLMDPSFLIFVMCSFLVCIPLSFYYAQANVFLTEIDAWKPTALQTIGQLSEVGFMLAMPFFIVKLGVKRMLMCGMLAWSLRYLAFGSFSLPLIVFGLFLHGICYDFFFVASQIYVDSRADGGQRASAQSFIAFVTLGLGMFVGSYLSGVTVDMYQPRQQIEITVTSSEDGSTETKSTMFPNWSLDNPNTKEDERTGLAAMLNLNADTKLTAELINEPLVVKNEAKGNETTYSVAALQKAVQDADLDKSGGNTREEWRTAQRKDWFFIWLWPAIGGLLTCGLFYVGFTDGKPEAAHSGQEPGEELAGQDSAGDEAGGDEA